MSKPTRRRQTIRGWCLTEDPTLYGLVTRERGQLVEFISYREASRRLALAAPESLLLSAGAECSERDGNPKGG